MENSICDFSSSNFTSSTPLTAVKDWTLYYSSDSISKSLENSDFFNDLVNAYDSIESEITEFASCMPCSGSKVEYTFRSPIHYKTCFDEENSLEKPIRNSEFKTVDDVHDTKLDEAAPHFTNANVSNIPKSKDGKETVYGNLESPCGHANNPLKILNAINENKSVLSKTEGVNCHQMFLSDQSTSNNCSCLSFLNKLANNTSLCENNYRSSPSVDFSNNMYDSLKNEGNNCIDVFHNQKETGNEDFPDFNHEILTSSIYHKFCMKQMKSKSEKFGSKHSRSYESLKKPQVSESIDALISNQLSDNGISFIDEKFSCLSVIPEVEVTNEENSVNFEMESNNKCDKNVPSDLNPTMSPSNLFKEIYGKQIKFKSRTDFHETFDSKLSKTGSAENLEKLQVSESIDKDVSVNNHLYANSDFLINESINYSSEIPELEIPDKRNPVNPEMKNTQCKKNTHNNESILKNNTEIGSITVTDILETMQEPIDLYLKQDSESCIPNHDAQLIQGNFTEEKTSDANGKVCYQDSNYLCQNRELFENRVVHSKPYIIESKNCFTEDCGLNTSLFYCFYCGNPFSGYFENNPLKNEAKGVSECLIDDDISPSINVKMLFDLLEVNNELSKNILLALSSKCVENGMTEREILNHIKQFSFPETIVKLKQDIKLFLNATLRNGIIESKGKRYFLKRPFNNEDHVSIQIKEHTVTQFNTENSPLEKKEDLKTLANIKKRKCVGVRKVEPNVRNKSGIQDMHTVKRRKAANSGLETGKDLPKSTSIKQRNSAGVIRVEFNVENKLGMQKNMRTVKQRKAENIGLEKGKDLKKLPNIKKMKSVGVRRVESNVVNKTEIQNSMPAFKRRKVENNKLKNGKAIPTITNIKKVKSCTSKFIDADVRIQSEIQENNVIKRKRATRSIKSGNKDVSKKLKKKAENCIVESSVRNELGVQQNQRKREDEGSEFENMKQPMVGVKETRRYSLRSVEPNVDNKLGIMQTAAAVKLKNKFKDNKLENDLPKMADIEKLKEDIKRGGSNARNKSEVQKNKSAVERTRKTKNSELKNRNDFHKIIDNMERKSFTLRKAEPSVGNELDILKNNQIVKRTRKSRKL